MDKDRRLTLAHGQLGAVLDRVALTLEPPDHRVMRVVGPVDDVDELAGEKIENTHVQLLLFRPAGGPYLVHSLGRSHVPSALRPMKSA